MSEGSQSSITVRTSCSETGIVPADSDYKPAYVKVILQFLRALWSNSCKNPYRLINHLRQDYLKVGSIPNLVKPVG